jgi:uncharacterized membrane protein YdjX (TVP38/TMEM64 family)
MHASPQPAARRGFPLRLVALVAVIGAVFVVVAASTSLSSERVRDWIEPLGIGAPLAFIAVSSLLTCALFPGPLLAGASGLLFGTALGTPVSIASATLGAVLAFTISRRVARSTVEEMLGTRLAGTRAWLARNGFLAVLYARIAPGVPYTLVNYVAGLTPIRLSAFAAATAIGTAPRAFAYTALGGNLDNLRAPEALIAIGLLVAMAVGGMVVARHGRAPLGGLEPGGSATLPASPGTPAHKEASR